MFYGIALLILAVRLALINLNHAEYTDGILQLTYFSRETNLWPPFYPFLCQALHYTLLDLEACGKLISILSSVAILYPIYVIAKILFGQKAALFAVLVYATQPIAWRWSLRVGTDSLYVLIFTSSLAVLIVALVEIEKLTLFKLRAFQDRMKMPAQTLLALSIMLGVLAGLTRFNAIILIPIQCYAIYKLYLRPGQKRFRALFLPVFAMFTWLLIFNMISDTMHGQQILERAGGGVDTNLSLKDNIILWFTSADKIRTLTNYQNLAESFIYLFPYFVTLPVFVMAVWGWVWMARGETHNQKQFAWITMYLLLATIAMQSVFQSFQERYLLPVIPLISILAGIAFAVWHRASIEGKKNPNLTRFYGVMIVVLLFAFAWSAYVLILQREMWGDIRRAAVFARELPIADNARIYSNEVYNAEMGIYAVKFPFWYGRPVEPLRLTPQGVPAVPPDSFIVLHSSYGGTQRYYWLQDLINQHYKAIKIREFSSRIIPVFPDIMAEPGTHQNPLAWVLRYEPQQFYTCIYQIQRPRRSAEAPLSPAPEAIQ